MAMVGFVGDNIREAADIPSVGGCAIGFRE